MWRVFEHRIKATKVLDKAPRQVREKYQFWKDMMERDGPQRVRSFKGFKDEALKGDWKGYRSSRLNDKYRVIYSINREEVKVFVAKVGPHNY